MCSGKTFYHFFVRNHPYYKRFFTGSCWESPVAWHQLPVRKSRKPDRTPLAEPSNVEEWWTLNILNVYMGRIPIQVCGNNSNNGTRSFSTVTVFGNHHPYYVTTRGSLSALPSFHQHRCILRSCPEGWLCQPVDCCTPVAILRYIKFI